MNSFISFKDMMDNYRKSDKQIIKDILENCFSDRDYPITVTLKEKYVFKGQNTEVGVHAPKVVDGRLEFEWLTIKTATKMLEFFEGVFRGCFVEEENCCKNKIDLGGAFKAIPNISKAMQLLELLDNAEAIRQKSNYSYEDFIKITEETVGLLINEWRFFSIGDGILDIEQSGNIRQAQKISTNHRIWLDTVGCLHYESGIFRYEIRPAYQDYGIECKYFKTGMELINTFVENANKEIIDFVHGIALFEQSNSGK